MEASRDPVHAAVLPQTAPLLTHVEATAEALVSASTDLGKQESLEAEAASASTDLGKQVLQEAEAASASTEAAPAPALPQDHLRTRPP